MALRSFIRRSISDMFYTFVYETESLQGVGELLEILGRYPPCNLHWRAWPLSHR